MKRIISDCIPENDLQTTKLYEFNRTTNAFNFVFEKQVGAGEAFIVKLPPVSANKRGINDIGWISDCQTEKDADGNEIPMLKLYGTLTENPRNPNALIQEIRVNDEINKVTSAIIVVNDDKENGCRLEMRAIFC
jgi:hypothetical protein